MAHGRTPLFAQYPRHDRGRRDFALDVRVFRLPPLDHGAGGAARLGTSARYRRHRPGNNGCRQCCTTACRAYDAKDFDQVKKPLRWADAGPGDNPLAAAYWMGTDTLGRDLRARFLHGRGDFAVDWAVQRLVAVLIGTAVGLIAGYAGGRVDALLMRVVDVLYGLPYILLVILMRVALVPPGGVGGGCDVGEFSGAAGGDRGGELADAGAGGAGSGDEFAGAAVCRGGKGAGVWRGADFGPAYLAEPRGDDCGVWHADGAGGGAVGEFPLVPGSGDSAAAAVVGEPGGGWDGGAESGAGAVVADRLAVRGLSLALLALNFVGDGLREAIDPKG